MCEQGIFMSTLCKILLGLLAIAFAHTPSAFAATDYSDLWWNPAESGWGVTLTQSDNVIFATFFVYARDGTPTWYSATLLRDSAGDFAGNLIATKGTFFGAPWVARNLSGVPVGTASFQPSRSNIHMGTLTYAAEGVGSATKTVERQTLTAIPLGGTYAGGQTGSYSGCTASSNNYPYVAQYDLQIDQANGAATFLFAYRDGLTCTLSGDLEQHGQEYLVPNATYACSDGLKTTASMSEIKRTSLSIEGRISATRVMGGCTENARFAAVL
jgi:hypothetical protein